MKLSLVMPAYNEEEHVEQVILDYQKHLNSVPGLEYEIIVVDDCSSDSTKDFLDNISGIKTLSNKINSGYGFSLKAGIAVAKYENIMITDADGSYPPQDAVRLINKFISQDMIIGSRTGDNINIPMYRRPAKFFLNNFASFLSRQKVPDLNSGLRIFKKKSYEIYRHLLPNAFSFTSTITLSMINDGKNVDFLPIDYLKRSGTSKIRPIQDFLNFTKLIIKMTLYFNPLKIFTLISGFMLILALSIFIYCKYYDFQLPDILLVSLIFTGITTYNLGLLADLVNSKSFKK